MHRVHIASKLQEETLAALKSLSRLRCLDISDRRTAEMDVQDEHLGGRLADQIMTANISDGAAWWCDLESFDLSGNELKAEKSVEGISVRFTRFLALHSHLRFVGVLDTVISSLPFLTRIDRLQVL